MNKISSKRCELHKNFVETRVKIRRRVTRSFTPLPRGYRRTIPRRGLALFDWLWEHNHGRPVTICYRQIAAALGVHVTTVKRWAYILEALGILHITRSPISWCRNAPNTFTFPQLDGFIVLEEVCKNATEVLNPERTTNTTTEAPRASAPGVPYARLRWEHHREWNHPPAMRALYEQNALLMAEKRTLRHRSCAGGWRGTPRTPETRLALLGRASVGIDRNPSSPLSTERLAAIQAAQKEYNRQRKALEIRNLEFSRASIEQKAREYRAELERMVITPGWMRR